jgi:autotransporter family porin
LPNSGGLRSVDPARLLDTRNGTWSTGIAASGATVRLRVAGRGGVPNDAAAALLTIAATGARGNGYVTAWACDESMPVASVLNARPGATRSNIALVKLSKTSGEVCLYTKSAGGAPVHLVADAVGWVPGGESRTPPPAPPTPPPAPSGRFVTLPVGSALPSGAECAARVRPAAEVRSVNTAANNNRGSRANANNRNDWNGFDRVDGNFAGTTDELIQWAACKWGIDEDIARAQIAKESWWHQSANGDNGESWGLGQVRDTAHQSAFEYAINARTSSAYNLDYTYAAWRACYEGVLTWLNNVERGKQYSAGDADGCLGVWFSGRWYTQPATTYIAAVNDYKNQRIWETQNFKNG